ncbi:DUF3703 domain-containing protein [Pontibacter litorisediminis]|uniref:DUF3703 domain-containing protein n=1 Tax=Pontibacter litorisediminis TaxID=1846260 RepID=UPI003B846810
MQCVCRPVAVVLRQKYLHIKYKNQLDNARWASAILPSRVGRLLYRAEEWPAVNGLRVDLEQAHLLCQPYPMAHSAVHLNMPLFWFNPKSPRKRWGSCRACW